MLQALMAIVIARLLLLKKIRQMLKGLKTSIVRLMF
jgi:hypothetical protein